LENIYIRAGFRNIRTGIPALLKCHYQVCAQIPPKRVYSPRPYPYFPLTIGDYLLKRRLDSGLLRKDVAKILNSNITSIQNWENNWRKPDLKSLPKIIKFISFCPYDATWNISKKVIIWRTYNGLSQKQMAQLANVDPTTLSRLEQGKRISVTMQQKILALTKLVEIS
jgi:transcriptional regulator with XRE-family HTH domain